MTRTYSQFANSACGSFAKNKERIHKFKEIGDSRYIYQIELDKACFQHEMAYGDFVDLPWRTASDKVLRDKAFNIAENPKYNRYQHGLASMVYKYCEYKSFSNIHNGTGINFVVVSENKCTSDLAEEFHKPFIRKFGKHTLYSSFYDNISDADFTDMQLISKFE